MTEEAAPGFGDLVDELQAELDLIVAQEKAAIPMTPSHDLPELLSAAIREIQGMRAIINRTQRHANGAPLWSLDGTLLDAHGKRSVFDDVDR